jgi:hypothetical protein
MSNEGLTFHRLGNFSTPLVVPFIFGSARSCSNETFLPDPVANSNVLPFGLPLPCAVFIATTIAIDMRRKYANTSSLLSLCSRGRGIRDDSWSQKYSKVRAIWSSTGSHPGIGEEYCPSFPRLTTAETKLDQSTNEMNS